MIKGKKSILIHRPINEVFAYMADLENGPQWQAGLIEVRRISEISKGTGARYSAVRKFLGRKVEGTVDVSAYELNHLITIKSDTGTVPFSQTTTFDSVAEGTQINTDLELHTSGFMGLAEPLIAASMNRDLDSNFADLKDLLESRVAVASPG